MNHHAAAQGELPGRRGWRAWLLAAGVAGWLALAGCAEAPPPPLTVGMNAWVGFDPLVLARDRGLVDEQRIKLVELASGTEVQRGLHNGLLDAAALTLDEAMRLTDAGMALRVVALLDASHGSDMVVVRPDLPSAAGLRGAFVAVEDSSVGTLMLQRMLQTAGLSRSDVKVVNMDANLHLAALRSGRVDAAVSYAPLSGQLVAAGFKPVFTSREIPGEIVDVLVVRTDLLNKRPEAVDGLLRAWAGGLQALRADPAGAVRDLARGTELSPEAYAEVLTGLQFIGLEESLLQLSGPALGLEARAQAVAGALVDVGVLKRPPALRELLDVGPLRRVLDPQGGPVKDGAARWTPSGRWLAPLLLAVFATLAAGINYVSGYREVDAEVEAAETRRLLERLAVEQTRLSMQADSTNLTLVRRVVGGLGLYGGMKTAWLLHPDGTVQASLRRSDIGRDLQALIAERPALSHLGDLAPSAPNQLAIEVQRRPGTDEIVGVVPYSNGRRLIAVVDLGQPLAERHAQLRDEVLREALLLAVLVLVLAGLLHLVWFRRAERLSATLAAIGEGRLERRTGLRGRDELALIGAEADRMAERLQKQQQRLQHLYALVDRSPAVVIEWANRPGWPMTYLSRNVSQWGYTPEELLNVGVDWDDLVHPDDVARMNAEIASNWAAGCFEYRQEYRLRCADGRYAWLEDRTSVTRRADGEIDSISGILLDITAQKQAELSLREQSEVQRLFYDLPFIGMGISSPQRRQWLQVNDRLCQILGYSREQLLSTPWTEFTPQPDLDHNLELLESMMAGRTDRYLLRKRFIRGDGRTVHTELDVRAVRLADGSLHRLFATVQDITEQLQADEALREQKALLEQAEALAGLGSWRFDTASGAVWWSNQMFENIGRDRALGAPDTLAGYLDCLHPDDHSRIDTFMRSSEATETVIHAEFRRHPALGPERWFRASLERHRGPEGGWRYSGTLLDITPIKRAQLELQRNNAELERRVAERTGQLSDANRELEAFTYTVSHDLKAPLRGIDGYSQLLEEEYGPTLNDEARGFIVRIRRGVEQMSALINDLLAYSRMERRTLELQAIDVDATVGRVLDEYAADIERSGAQVEVQVPDAFSLTLDREGLTVVLRNLVGNALKFARPGQAPQVQIGARREAGRHLLWVRDEGVGFDMKYHERIFGIFQRLQRAEDYPGTGVGLALVAKAVQRMGGRVWADSQPGAGATFFLEFPA